MFLERLISCSESSVFSVNYVVDLTSGRLKQHAGTTWRLISHHVNYTPQVKDIMCSFTGYRFSGAVTGPRPAGWRP